MQKLEFSNQVLKSTFHFLVLFAKAMIAVIIPCRILKSVVVCVMDMNKTSDCVAS